MQRLLAVHMSSSVRVYRTAPVTKPLLAAKGLGRIAFPGLMEN